jgi:hypothetical protein
MPQMGTFEKTKANGRLAHTNKLSCRLLLASTTQGLDGNIEAKKSDCMSDKDKKKQSQRVTGKLIVDNGRTLLHFHKSPANCDGATHCVNAEPTGNMDSMTNGTLPVGLNRHHFHKSPANCATEQRIVLTLSPLETWTVGPMEPGRGG